MYQLHQRHPLLFLLAGDYTVRLITNKNDQCSDTGYTVAKVYPGFTTDFTVQETCKGVPYVFTDGSKTIYGTINQWKWDFGNANATNDTAITATASYVYPQTGVFAVSLIVSNKQWVCGHSLETDYCCRQAKFDCSQRYLDLQY